MNDLTYKWCPVFLEKPELNDKENMMGYRHTNIYHKYVHNKIKIMLMI